MGNRRPDDMPETETLIRVTVDERTRCAAAVAAP
jgi:hypothetical protein